MRGIITRLELYLALELCSKSNNPTRALLSCWTLQFLAMSRHNMLGTLPDEIVKNGWVVKNTFVDCPPTSTLKRRCRSAPPCICLSKLSWLDDHVDFLSTVFLLRLWFRSYENLKTMDKIQSYVKNQHECIESARFNLRYFYNVLRSVKHFLTNKEVATSPKLIENSIPSQDGLNQFAHAELNAEIMITNANQPTLGFSLPQMPLLCGNGRQWYVKAGAKVPTKSEWRRCGFSILADALHLLPHELAAHKTRYPYHMSLYELAKLLRKHGTSQFSGIIILQQNFKAIKHIGSKGKVRHLSWSELCSSMLTQRQLCYMVGISRLRRRSEIFLSWLVPVSELLLQFPSHAICLKTGIEEKCWLWHRRDVDIHAAQIAFFPHIVVRCNGQWRTFFCTEISFI